MSDLLKEMTKRVKLIKEHELTIQRHKLTIQKLKSDVKKLQNNIKSQKTIIASHKRGALAKREGSEFENADEVAKYIMGVINVLIWGKKVKVKEFLNQSKEQHPALAKSYAFLDLVKSAVEWRTENKKLRAQIEVLESIKGTKQKKSRKHPHPRKSARFIYESKQSSRRMSSFQPGSDASSQVGPTPRATAGEHLEINALSDDEEGYGTDFYTAIGPAYTPPTVDKFDTLATTL
eukprot:UN28132